MSVHFVYRCHYVNPSGKHVAHFPDDSVLAWFQRHWPHLCEDTDQAYDRVEALLGCNVYGFSCLFERAAEEKLPPPNSDEDLTRYLNDHLHVEGMVSYKAHLMQALTDDDELMMAYFIFDDHFLSRYGDRAAYLLTEGWQLPGGAGAAGFRPKTKTKPIPLGGQGEGTTYAVLLSVFASDHLDLMDESYRFEGLRLPDLVRHLVCAGNEKPSLPFEMQLLWTQLLASPPKCSPTEKAFLTDLRLQQRDDPAWQVYSDWLVDQGELPAGLTLLQRALQRLTRFAPREVNYSVRDFDLLLMLNVEEARRNLDRLAKGFRQREHDPRKARVHVEEHLAQLCPYAGEHFGHDEWHQWYFFDDLWAGAHPAIAEGLLRYGKRWDVLSGPSSKPNG
jgi:hypothetical protein